MLALRLRVADRSGSLVLLSVAWLDLLDRCGRTEVDRGCGGVGNLATNWGIRLGEDPGAVSTIELRLFLHALTELLGVRIDGLTRARGHVPRDLAPVLAEESDRSEEALMLIICPVALATPALMLDHDAARVVRGVSDRYLALGQGFLIAQPHLLFLRERDVLRREDLGGSSTFSQHLGQRGRIVILGRLVQK